MLKLCIIIMYDYGDLIKYEHLQDKNFGNY